MSPKMASKTVHHSHHHHRRKTRLLEEKMTTTLIIFATVYFCYLSSTSVSAIKLGSGSSVSSGEGRGGGVGFRRIPFTPPSNASKLPKLRVGVILPHSNFKVREYIKAIKNAATFRPHRFEFLEYFHLDYTSVILKAMPVNPSPTVILSALCKEFLPKNVSAILYLTNTELYGRNTASAQYFLQLAGYLGIPVVAWNADNSGLERKVSRYNLRLQLAPSIEHQCAAMLSVLVRYNWHQFAIVTSQIAGHNDFVQAVRDKVLEREEEFKFTILKTIKFKRKEDLMDLEASEARVMLLYSTTDEAKEILNAARERGLTGRNYVWIATQSIIGSNPVTPDEFPIGMLGVHFNTREAKMIEEIETAFQVFAHGVERAFEEITGRDKVKKQRKKKKKLKPKKIKMLQDALVPDLSCESDNKTRWTQGEELYKFLRNTTVPTVGKHRPGGIPAIKFHTDGTILPAELKIMNLKPSISDGGPNRWEEIGTWRSWEETNKLEIKDIVWPGDSPVPPEGVPEKFHLKVTFLEEAPFMNLVPQDPVTGRCAVNRGVPCKVSPDYTKLNSNGSKNATEAQCCSGFCIDLLEKFAEDLGFTYELVRVDDPKWGTLVGGKWNGLMGALVNHKTDMVMSALKINSDREAAVDFTVPFMHTGISIVVAKRTGIISPTAFLEPFDRASWMLVGLVAIQVSALALFVFEWLSPSGYDMKCRPPKKHKFSLARAYWLVWAFLFGAAVNVDCPRGITSRFMASFWAAFAVVFLAIYTANLAAFMITKEEYHDFKGLDDPKLAYPTTVKPPFRFGTIPYGNTEATLQKFYPQMYAHMRKFNRSVVKEGIEAVHSGQLDAFVYDGTVLEYLVSQDEECKLLTVGGWSASTGYGVAFPKGAKYLPMFNKQLLEYRDNGDIERLSRFWLMGLCRPNQRKRSSSNSLTPMQFLSAFYLLMAGIAFAFLLLGLEKIYFSYFRRHLVKAPVLARCCALISVSMSKSMQKDEDTLLRQIMKMRSCQDPRCDSGLRKLQKELNVSRQRIADMEKALKASGVLLPPLPYSPSYASLQSSFIRPSSNVTTVGFAGPIANSGRLERRSKSWVDLCCGMPINKQKKPEGSAQSLEIAEIETVL